MFGTNKIAEPFLDPKGSLRVNDLFYTLQGEGPDAGRPAIFLRLAGCNLRCYFCDTEFERSKPIMSAEEVADAIFQERFRAKRPCDLVVITGGEPLLQNIVPLVRLLNLNQKLTVAIETAGTYYVPEMEFLFHSDRRQSPYGNAIICSPKTPRVNPLVARSTHAIKYIVNHGDTSSEDGLPVRSTQKQDQMSKIARPDQFAPNAQIYIQPQDTGDPHKNRLNELLASSICMDHGYRLSIQLHKIVDLP